MYRYRVGIKIFLLHFQRAKFTKASDRTSLHSRNDSKLLQTTCSSSRHSTAQTTEDALGLSQRTYNTNIYILIVNVLLNQLNENTPHYALLLH